MWSKDYELLWAEVMSGKVMACFITPTHLNRASKPKPLIATVSYSDQIKWNIRAGGAVYSSPYVAQLDGHNIKEAFFRDCETLELIWATPPPEISDRLSNSD